MTLSTTVPGFNYSATVSIYPYQATISSVGLLSPYISVNLWYGWTALVLLIIGAIVGIAGSLSTKEKLVIFIGGFIILLAIVIFTIGLQSQLTQPLATDFPHAGIFSSGSYGTRAEFNYISYLSYGFWIALASAIILFVAAIRKTTQAPPSMPMQTIPSPSQPS